MIHEGVSNRISSEEREKTNETKGYIMASAHEENKVIITMSPKELRDLADKMEREFPKKKLGESCFIGILGHTKTSMVVLHADQEWFHKNK